MLQPRQAFFAPTAIPQSLPLEWRTPQSLPLEGLAVLNDTPVACQTRRPTDPQGDRCPRRGRMRRRRRSGASVVFVSAGDNFAPRRERFLCLRRPHFFQQRKKWGKERRQKLRFCTSSARYTALVCKAAPPRNRHFLTRCRSPDCASTAFRCRCLLLRQKLFVLPCRRLRNNYNRARRAHLPLPPQGGKGAI